MANTLKQVAVVGITTVQTIYTASASGSGKSLVIHFDVANAHATLSTRVTIKLVKSGGTPSAYLIRSGLIPVNSSLRVCAGQRIILEANDFITVLSDNGADVTASIIEGIAI